MFRLLALLGGAFSACVEPTPQPDAPPTAQTTGAAAAPAALPEVRIAVIGTSDLHGYVEARTFSVQDRAGQAHTVHRGGLPLLGGYLDNLRARQPVLLLDAGDMFQGTMASNMGEGQGVVEAYNILGYQAAAIGNHEFDFGPVGPRAVPGPSGADDPNGALKARAAAAHFPFLSANLLEKKTGQHVPWANVKPSTLVEIAGVPIGIIGALTEDTPQTTNSLNLRDVSIGKLIPAIRTEAAALRAAGVAAIVLSIHEGANCQAFDDPRDLKPCTNNDEKVISLVRALDGAVDAVVAGHTHAGIAHFVGDIPVIQSFSYGISFGRVDLVFKQQNGKWQIDRSRAKIYPPAEVCDVALPDVAAPPKAEASGLTDLPASVAAAAAAQGTAVPPRPPSARCDARALNGTDLRPAEYEGKPIVPNAAVEAVLKPHVDRAHARAETLLGVTLGDRVRRNFRAESPLAQMMADLIRSGASRVLGQPVDGGVQNGGGIRNDLPAGPLKYAQVFEVQPFDNRLAILRLTGAQITEVFRRNLGSGHGVLVPSGLQVDARCQGDELIVNVKRDTGEPLEANKIYSLAMSDFLAAGGDSFTGIASGSEPGKNGASVTYFDDVLLRELIVEELQRYRGPLLSGQIQPARLHLPAPRPIHCPLPPKP